MEHGFTYYGCTIPYDFEEFTLFKKRNNGEEQGKDQSDGSFARKILMYYFPKQSIEAERSYEWYNFSCRAYRRFIQIGVNNYLASRSKYYL